MCIRQPVVWSRNEIELELDTLHKVAELIQLVKMVKQADVLQLVKMHKLAELGYIVFHQIVIWT